MKEKLIDIGLFQGLFPVFKKPYGPFLARCIMKIAGLNKVNRVYDAGKYEKGTDIEAAMVKSMGITPVIHNIEVLKLFDGQSFITVSNHPYGHIDGIMLIGEVAKFRPNYKMMVNWMLGLIDVMEDHFIGVNPYSSGKVKKSSLEGIKECILHLKNNHPLGFFPAGAVSKNIGRNRVKDREWQDGVIKLIKKANVPVIPVYISGQNSWLFNFLDKIDWRVRTLRLGHELDTKKGKTIHLVFGDPIMPPEQETYTDIKQFGEFLKKQTYLLKNKLSTI